MTATEYMPSNSTGVNQEAGRSPSGDTSRRSENTLCHALNLSGAGLHLLPMTGRRKTTDLYYHWTCSVTTDHLLPHRLFPRSTSGTGLTDSSTHEA